MPARPQAKTKPAKKSAAKAEDGPVIVLVDDEIDLLMALSDHFRASLPAARIFPAESGPAALEFIRDNPADLVVMDWRMPGLTGLELADLLKLARRPPATILMTAHPSLGLAYQATGEHGFSAIFSKPFDPAVMVKTALRLIEGRGARRGRGSQARRGAIQRPFDRGHAMPSHFRTLR